MGLLALGVLQPASAAEVRAFLSSVFRDGGRLPPASDFEQFLEDQLRLGHALQVVAGPPRLFSLTLKGNHYLPLVPIRRLRDKLRMYLLRDSHRGRFIESRGDTEEGLAGDSPATDTSSGLKGTAANKFGRAGQIYWPRIPGQFVDQTGLTRPSRDTFPPFLSFESPEQAAIAAGSWPDQFEMDYVGLALCVGVSTKLISQISHNAQRHYRLFTLPKRGGGERKIESPRVFLKVIQWFLADFVLQNLPIHPTVHSFLYGRSIVTNAQLHVARRFVANTDIRDFFGSITPTMITHHLSEHGFKPAAAELLVRLCVSGDHLPQGAPTSPVLSNSILYRFDRKMERVCTSMALRYSRYADDITISGDNNKNITNAIQVAKKTLERYFDLHLHGDKTRIASFYGQQRVTGVIVNERVAPPRRFRRKIRALFHQASLQPAKHLDRISEMVGYIGYLKSFPELRSSRMIARYEDVVRHLRSVRGRTTLGRAPSVGHI